MANLQELKVEDVREMRQKLDQFMGKLERFISNQNGGLAASIDRLSKELGGLKGPARSISKPARLNAKPDSAARSRVTARATPAGAKKDEERLLTALRSVKEAPAGELAKKAGLTANRTAYILGKFRKQKAVKMKGSTSAARWSLTKK
jgi:Tfp pilus assembly protein PilE